MTILLAALLLASLTWLLLRAWRVRQSGIALVEQDPADETPLVAEPLHDEGLLRRWLTRAGYPRVEAPLVFVVSTAVAIAVGGGFYVAVARLAAAFTPQVRELPGGIGDMLAGLIDLLPTTAWILAAITPLLIVRAARARRVREVERDLPLVLELLATLAQAGLSFDAALGRVIEFQPAARPLTTELRGFRRDLLAGSPRLLALRQLAARVDVTSLTVFVSAVIQTEQVGSSIAETLRLQAEDLRARRRERALLLAQALPVKLVVPLVACFLPGIFLSTLGPVLFQMIQVANSVLRPIAP